MHAEDWLKLLVSPSVFGLIGIYVGSVLTKQRDLEARRLAFRERQLREFYGPIHAMVMQLDAASQTGMAARLHGENLLEKYSQSESAKNNIYERINKVQDYQAKSMRDANEIWVQMAKHVQSNIGLAEPSTISKYPALLRIVANRDFVKTAGLPLDWVGEWPPKWPADPEDPTNITPFLNDVERRYEELRTLMLPKEAKPSSKGLRVEGKVRKGEKTSSNANLPLPFVTGVIGLFCTYIFPRLTALQGFLIGFVIGVCLLFLTVYLEQYETRKKTNSFG